MPAEPPAWRPEPRSRGPSGPTRIAAARFVRSALSTTVFLAKWLTLAFQLAGGVTSLPAAIAVWALVKKPVFGLYIALALGGSLAAGLLIDLWRLL